MKYNQPYGQIDPNAGYVDGNPVVGQQGSIIPAAAVEQPQREIINAIVAAGLAGNGSDLTQLTQAIELLGRIPYCIDQGIADQLVINPVPAVTQYGGTQPKIYAVDVAYANDGASYVNVSGLGAIPLTRVTGDALSANDLVPNGIVIIGENATGTGFQLLSVPGSLAFPTPQQLWHYGVDVSTSVNSVVATIDNIGTSIPTGIAICLKIAHTNTGPVTVAINGLTAVSLYRGSGGALANGDIASGYIAVIMFDGSEFQLINFLNGAAGGAGGNDITGPDSPYWLSVKSATVTSPPGSPTLGDTYLIPSTGSGAWSGLGGRLGQWNGTSWVYRSYPVTSIVGAADSGLFYECTVAGTTWVIVQIMSLGKIYFYAQL